MNDSILGRMRPAQRAKVYYAVGFTACLSGTLVAECTSDFFLSVPIFFPAAAFLFFSLCHEIGFMVRKPRS